MRAAYIRGKEALEIREESLPEPGPQQVRLSVDYVGICGSDLHYYFDGENSGFVLKQPLIPGHELAARVDRDHSGQWPPGTPVTVHPARYGQPTEGDAITPHLRPGGSYLGSASTDPHTQGALAEQLVVDRSMVRPLPDGLPVRRAVLAEPLAVALHAVRLAGDLAGARVLVNGSGPIGLLAIAASRAAGAGSVTATDVEPGPLARASALGADATVDVSSTPLPESAYDVAIECSGVAASAAAAFHAVRPQGTVVQVGMIPETAPQPPLSKLIAKELRLHGAFRFHDEIDEAIRLLAAEPGMESVITHEFSLEEAETAFLTARDAESSGKVIVAVRSRPENRPA